MPFVKVKEFKSNEIISHEDFNESFGAFRNLQLDGENFADESLGVDQIPRGISLTDTSKLLIGSQSFASSPPIMMQNDHATDPFLNPGSAYTASRVEEKNHPSLNKLVLNNLEVGDKFIIRASCAVDVKDGGWRTFSDGLPPIFKVGLVRFPGETSVSEGSVNSNGRPIDSTVAHYRIAFTGKVPSASSLSKEAVDGYAGLFYKDVTIDLKYQYRDSRKLTPESSEDHDPLKNKTFLPFSGYHSYTTAFLYTHAGGDTTQLFSLMCWFGDYKIGAGTDETTGGKGGARTPDPSERARIRDLRTFVYQVKK